MNIPEDWWDQLRAAYPKRAGDNGWIAVRMLVPRRMTEGHTWETILAGTKNYAAHAAKTSIVGTGFVKQAKTFYGPDCWFDEWSSMDTRTPAEIAQERLWEALKVRAVKVGFRDRRPTEPLASYESCLRDVERTKEGPGQPKFQVVR
jgi:hypothetical protein